MSKMITRLPTTSGGPRSSAPHGARFEAAGNSHSNDEQRTHSQRSASTDNGTVLSIDKFCTLFGVGRTFAYGEIGAGRLIARKAGRRTLIAQTDALAWLERLPVTKGVERS